MTSRRRLARIARAVSRAALRTPRPAPAAVGWKPRDLEPESVNFAHTLARNGNALAHLAAVVTRHMPGASRLSKRARRCALATIERETRSM